MPAVGQRGGGRRRTINEINMVPFIDVMLVLLIIFMVTAPLITTGVVDVPTVGKAGKMPKRFIELQIDAAESMRLRVDGKERGSASMADLAARVIELRGDETDVAVVIAADKGVKYERVVQAMSVLQTAGLERVGLSLKTSGR